MKTITIVDCKGNELKTIEDKNTFNVDHMGVDENGEFFYCADYELTEEEENRLEQLVV